jgi:hypothetical protein
VVGDDPTDEGQMALEAAEAQNLNYNFKVELNDKLTLGGENSLHFFIGRSCRRSATSATPRTWSSGPSASAINSAITDTDPS